MATYNDNLVTPVSTGTMKTLSTTMPKNRGMQPVVDPALEASRRAADQLDTQRRIEEEIATKARNNDYYNSINGTEDSKRLIFALNNNLDSGLRYTPEFEALYNASNTPVVDNSVVPVTIGTQALGAGTVVDTKPTTNTPDIYSEYIEPFTRQNLLNSNPTNPNLIAQLQRSASEDATKNLTSAQLTAAKDQGAQLTKLNTSTLGAGTVVDTKPTTSIGALGTAPITTLSTSSIGALDTKPVGGLTTQPASVTPTGGIPALTTADLASWGKTLPQGLTSDQLTSALNTQQTALSKQNEEFLKNWNTSANTLKTDILSGVEAKNKQFGTEATQGFMDAFKNFQIPTNQQTGVNLGNYNDNRNAAADQWWSQYVTGRR